jgi:D-amino-acid dehydrogenase
MGVEFIEHFEAVGFSSEGRKARTVQTSGQPQPGDVFVITAGAWTPRLGRHLGRTIPIQPGKGYSMTMPRPSICPKIPLIFPEHRVAVTPMQSGYRLGSTMEFAGYDTSIPRQRLDLLKSAAEHYLREPYCEPVQETWYG